MTSPAAAPMRHSFLNGSGPLGQMIDGHDWSASALGPIDQWPPALRTVVALMLRSPLAMITLWGHQGSMIYNEAYARFAGARHPHIMGMGAREGWPEVADFNSNVLDVVLAGGTLRYTNQELVLHQRGTPEAHNLNLDYSPITDDAGVPVGVLAIVTDVTDQVRAQRMLDAHQTRVQTMFEQAPGFVAMLTGPEHVFTMTNHAYSKLVRQRVVLGRSVREALPEAAEQGFVALLDQLYASGASHTGTATPFTMTDPATGATEQRYLDFVYQPLAGDDGAVFGIFVHGIDATERVIAERSVRDSELKFRTLAQAVPNQVWSACPDGTLDWFNARVYDYSGAAPGQLDAGNWIQIVHADDAAGALHAWQAAVAAGRVYEREFRIRRHDGAYRWFLVRAVPIHNAAGTPRRWIGTNTDIEDHKSTEQALAHQNRDLAMLVDQRTSERDRMWRQATDILLVAQRDGAIVAVNPALTTLLGWAEHEVVGRPFRELVHPDARAAVSQAMAAAADDASGFKLEAAFLRRDDGYNLVAWTGTHDGELIYLVGRDITAERAAAAAVKRTEQALLQTQKMDTIGKLTGGVAHDFNNLLQVISGNLQLLAGDVADNARAQHRIKNALAGVTRGARLASSLLAFGRRQALEPTVVKLSRQLSAMEDMLRRSLGEEIELEFVVSGGLWTTLVDVGQVENAVLNLCVNARDAMDGVGKLTIEVGNAVLDDAYADDHAEVARGQYVMIAVSDTGHGMSAEVMAQAFDPFFSTKPEGKGTGLGLSMVYGFVKQSGGHVKIYSEPGLGTSVKLYLPRSFAPEDAAVVVDTREVVGGDETVLVVEDDEGVRKTVVEMLKELGYEVLQAAEAVGALAIVNSGMPIDLLFTDVVMPGPLRSPELARAARAVLPNLAVLFTSGYTENAIVHGGRLDAGVDLLGKPYTRAAMAQKIRHVLANQQQRSASAHAAAALRSAPARTGLRILLVEDDEDMRLTTAELLACMGHTVEHAGSAEHALDLLNTETEVMITDIQLPGMSGETLALKCRERLPMLGIVFASGQSQAIALPGAVNLGKPYDMAALAAALAAAA
jgi:PAS domain S-box-containing protein